MSRNTAIAEAARLAAENLDVFHRAMRRRMERQRADQTPVPEVREETAKVDPDPKPQAAG